jgi:hypothetical protein
MLQLWASEVKRGSRGGNERRTKVEVASSVRASWSSVEMEVRYRLKEK